MKPITLLTFFLLITYWTSSQSLGSDRIAKIKNSTVRITIENSNSMGTGFFVTRDGLLVTCWHVIVPALVLDKNGEISSVSKIYGELSNGKRIQLGIPYQFYRDFSTRKDAIAYDYCLLVPTGLDSVVDYLNVGKYEDVQEGDVVYTCGYPVGISQQFISKGIVSTKYIDSANLYINRTPVKIPRDVALLDLTLNRGNSGGAIVKVGKTVNDDKVIGIADFIITPIAGIADSLINKFNEAEKYGSVEIQGVDPNKTFSLMTELISSLSIGVSGCVSADYFQKLLAHKK